MISLVTNLLTRMGLGFCLICGLWLSSATLPVTARPAGPEAVTEAGDDDWQTGFTAAGMTGIVNALAVDNVQGYLYAGGSFYYAGDKQVYKVARYDGSDWVSLDAGLNNDVFALALDSEGRLYAGGIFTDSSESGASLTRVARWDGSDWSPLGSGISDSVYALAVDKNDRLYAGGGFSSAGGVSVQNIAKWDPSANSGAGAWNALGSGIVGLVNALAVDSNNRLYAGGSFTTAGGVSVSNIAMWDPAANSGAGAWSALGGGLTGGQVFALTVANNDDLRRWHLHERWRRGGCQGCQMGRSRLDRYCHPIHRAGENPGGGWRR